ncbi:MAG TPA: vanadium-dependent haloperoxidase [Blastocatellia bacterium]|nr:vanadium-dependent haloperoxidase [Blastocatellia bacterium]
MKTNTSWKRVVIVVALGAALSGVPAYPSVSEAIAADPLLISNPGAVASGSSMPLQPQSSYEVTEWTQQAVTLASFPQSDPAPVNQVLEWNQIFIDTLIATNTANSSSPRLGAIVHTAIFDAYNGIERQYTPIFVQDRAPKKSSSQAAVIAAAYTALVGLFPSRQSALEASYATSLAAVRDECEQSGKYSCATRIERGTAWGTEVAQAVLAWRATDGFSGSYPSFTGGTAFGQWRRTPPAFGPMSAQGLAFTAMFVLDSNTQFAPEPPRSLTSRTYTDDFNAVKALGRKTGSTRTEDQTALAAFWEGNASVHWNQAANQIARAKNLSMSDSNRLLAVLNIAMADTVFTTWKSKRSYGEMADQVTWRPVSSIPLADADGNPDTSPDPDWEPLINTPSHPEYPAGHPSLNGAAATVLLRHFRRRQTFTLTTAGQPSRTYTSITQARSDGNNARVWGGMHYPSTVDISDFEGEAIARYVDRKSMQLRNPVGNSTAIPALVGRR